MSGDPHDDQEIEMLRQLQLESDPQLAVRNILADIWHYACLGSVLLYAVVCLVFKGYVPGLPAERFSDASLRQVRAGDGAFESWDNDQSYKTVSLVSSMAVNAKRWFE